jgi:putative ABC transport system permease protein
MKLDDLLATSWRMVYRNRKRYKTVIVAIAIGTLGFIMIRTLGDSVESKVSDNLDLIGEATILRAQWNDRNNLHLGEYHTRDLEELRKIPHVLSVAPIRTSEMPFTVLCLKVECKDLFLAGVDENYWQSQAPRLSEGRLINASDVEQNEKVCVLGRLAAATMVTSGNPIDKVVTVGSHGYKIVGVLGGSPQDDISKTVFIPISLASHHLGGFRLLTEFYVRVDTFDNVHSVRQQVIKTLKRLHPEQSQGVRVFYKSSSLERVRIVVFMVKMFSYAALVVIFILGKIGLTNVMLAAIQERTKEIGLRKSMGATDSTIRSQFMIEAVLVSIVASVIGTLGGVALVMLLKGHLGVQVSQYVMSTSIAMDLGFTTLIGVAAGLYPSLQASKLDVVTAMRFE